MFPQQITKEEVNLLPLHKYEGKIVVVTTQDQLKEVMDEVKQQMIVGFDTETKPSFRKGVWYYISLLQLAIPDKVFLIRLNYTGFTQELCDFFNCSSVKKVGISIRDDLKNLKKLAAKYHLPFASDNIIELNTIANTMGIQHAGVRNLTAIFLQFRVSKAQQTSNWENPQLTEKQIRYAATDAWVCLEIYNHLDNLGYI